MFFDEIIGFSNKGSYAGVGSRKINSYYSLIQIEFAFCMTLFGFRLNTGGAPGSDTSYEFGAKMAYDFLSDKFNLPKGEYERVMSIYLPWLGFNGRVGADCYQYLRNKNALMIAEKFHSGWLYLSDAARRLMVRNGYQILGNDLCSPVNFVACYTPDGAVSYKDTTGKTGGTGQAIRIASSNNISVLNIGRDDHLKIMEQKLLSARAKILSRFGIDSRKYVDEMYRSYNPIPSIKSKCFSDLLLDGKFDIFVHGANCQNVMGAGVAKVVKEKFGEAYLADQATKKGDVKKMGFYSSALIKRQGAEFSVINAYTQYKYGNDSKVKIDYESTRKVFKRINEEFSRDKSILIPKIGCGKANGCWVSVSDAILTEMKGRNIRIVDDGNLYRGLVNRPKKIEQLNLI